MPVGTNWPWCAHAVHQFIPTGTPWVCCAHFIFRVQCLPVIQLTEVATLYCTHIAIIQQTGIASCTSTAVLYDACSYLYIIEYQCIYCCMCCCLIIHTAVR